MKSGEKEYQFNCVKISEDVGLNSDGSINGLKLACSYYHPSQKGSIFSYCSKTAMPCVVQPVFNGVKSLENFLKEVNAKRKA